MKLRPLLLSCLAFALPALAEPAFTGEAGLQLYSLRDEFKKGDVPATLDRVKGYGVKEVETATTYNLKPEEFLKLLQERQLKPISGQKDLPGVIAAAKALGLQYVVCPWIPHPEADFTAESVKAAAADFNAWGEALKKEGIQFGYHCHGYEFRPEGDGTLFDLLMKETKPEFVTFEMDVFWVTHPGQDPVKLLAKYPGRWQLMHLKDMRKGAKTGIYTGHAGVKHYFIEDESPTAVTAIPQSLSYLKTLQ